MEDEKFFESEGYTNVKKLPNKGWCALGYMAFTVGLFIGLQEYSYHGRYCYPSFEEAEAALKTWDGKDDPPGAWIKYKGIGGERRNPKIS